MKDCELCGRRARMFCESDQASLCWDCDEKVHCANFLVAKHCRSLLCCVCQSPTPWKASGSKLTPTVSVCQECVELQGGKCERGRGRGSRGGNDEGDLEVEEENDAGSYEERESEGEYEDDYGDDDEEEEEEEEEDDYEDDDGENQVVPWSCISSPSPSRTPPPAVSSSSEGETSGGCVADIRELKRRREDSIYLDSDEEIGCSSSHLCAAVRPLANDESVSLNFFKPLKHPRLTEPNQSASAVDRIGREESRSTAVIGSIQRLQDAMISNMDDASRTIFAIRNLSRDQGR